MQSVEEWLPPPWPATATPVPSLCLHFQTCLQYTRSQLYNRVLGFLILTDSIFKTSLNTLLTFSVCVGVKESMCVSVCAVVYLWTLEDNLQS